VEIKRQLDATEVFIADLIACSTCFGASLCPSSGAQEYYTVVAACGISCCGFSSSWSGVELRVMRPVCRMQEPLLHLVGILFPHINDDARSKSHQRLSIFERKILCSIQVPMCKGGQWQIH